MRAVAFLLILASPAFAHRLTVEVRATPDALVIVAGYDDDTPAERTNVQVFAASDELFAGLTDETGTAKFPRPAAGTVRIVADDGTGHRCETTFDVPATASAAQPADRPDRGPRVAFGLALIFAATLAWKNLRRVPSPPRRGRGLR